MSTICPKEAHGIFMKEALGAVEASDALTNAIRRRVQPALAKAQLNLKVAIDVPPLNPDQRDRLQKTWQQKVNRMQEGMNLIDQNIERLRIYRQRILKEMPEHDCPELAKPLDRKLIELIGKLRYQDIKLIDIFRTIEPEKFEHLEIEDPVLAKYLSSSRKEALSLLKKLGLEELSKEV